MAITGGPDLLEPSVEVDPDAVAPDKVYFSDVLTGVWLAITAAWTVYFLHGLIDSRSVLVTFAEGFDRPLIEEDYFTTEMFRAFCGHGFRGNSVNSAFTNGLILALGGFVTYMPGFALGVVNVSRWERSRSRKFVLAIVAIVLVQFALMTLFWDTINLATMLGA